MDYSSLHMKTVVDLRKLAKELRVRLPAGMSKADIIQTLLDAEQSAAAAVSAAAKPASQEITPASESAAPRKRGRPCKNPAPVESAAVSPAASSEIGAPTGPVKTAASPQAGEFHGYRLGYSPRLPQRPHVYFHFCKRQVRYGGRSYGRKHCPCSTRFRSWLLYDRLFGWSF